MKVWILTHSECDRSAHEVVRVYLDEDRARSDYALASRHSYGSYDLFSMEATGEVCPGPHQDDAEGGPGANQNIAPPAGYVDVIAELDQDLERHISSHQVTAGYDAGIHVG